MRNFGLSGKNILVTGASGFLGEYICSALLDEGANVIKTDIINDSDIVKMNISDHNSVSSVFDNVMKKYVDIHGLVNNAAYSPKGANISSHDFSKAMDVNVKGAHNCITELHKRSKSNASVVNLASIYGLISPDFKIYDGNEDLFSSSVYGASKAAIMQLTRYYSVQYAPIRVNCVSPGGIFQEHNDKFTSSYSSRVPLKRMADPEEIVNGILFLLSPLSSYMTGHNLVIDGGISAM